MSEKLNYRNNCGSCGDAFEPSTYTPLVHLPPSWVLLLADEHQLDDYEWETAFVELCEDCIERFDYLKIESWNLYDPDALDEVTKKWVLRIQPDDLININ